MATVTLLFTFTNNHGEDCTEEREYDLTLDPAGCADEFIEEFCAELTADSEPEDEFTEETTWEGKYEIVDCEFEEGSFEPKDFDGDLRKMIDFAELLERSYNAEAVAAYVSENGIEYADSADDSFQGEYDSEEDFAQQLASDLGSVPDSMYCYIDWAKYARDVMMDYTAISHNGKVFIFRD